MQKDLSVYNCGQFNNISQGTIDLQRKWKMEEVVVTGMGVVSSLGHSAEELWSNLLAGKSGVGPIDRFDTEAYSVKFAGQVRNFDASP
jgi:hypothetical protein